MGECRGADWKNIATHARFTSNPDENSVGFRPMGLKRLEMLSSVGVHSYTIHLRKMELIPKKTTIFAWQILKTTGIHRNCKKKTTGFARICSNVH
jgi:hypothetical protein